MEKVTKKQASRRKYHYIYKTTCTITNKFYIGMHSTDNLEDGYIGSGKRLKNSINYHGKENHICEILEFLPNRIELATREKEIVNIELINEELCMNLKVGGNGGLGFISEEQQRKRSSAGGNAAKIKLAELNKDPEWRTKLCNNLSKGIKKASIEGRLITPRFTNKQHSKETKSKMSEKAKTREPHQNSQYGKCWITDGENNKKIFKGNYIPEGWKQGRTIKYNK